MQNVHRQVLEAGCGTAKNPSSLLAGAAAAKQALEAINIHSISLVLVFASVAYDLEEVLKGVRSVTGIAMLVGATTAGEICNGIQQETVTVTVLASPFLRIHCGLGKNVSQNWRQSLDEALQAPAILPFLQNPDYLQGLRQKGKDAFIMLFSPGNTSQNDGHSFELIETLKASPIGNFPIFGGCAADDWRMEKNYVFYNDHAYEDGLVIVVAETELRFGISLTHGFRPTGKSAVVTAADGHEILTLGGMPASDAYCDLLGLTKGDLLGSYLTYTTGATIGIVGPMEEYSINVASYFTQRGGVRLTRPIAVGTVLTRMEPDPARMVLAGEEALRRAIIRGGITEAAIGIVSYCALRQRILGEKSQQELSVMQDILAGKPLVGFCSLGEQGVEADGVSRENNSALACLVLGSQLSQTARIAFENHKLLREVKSQQKLLMNANTSLRREIDERIRIEKALRDSEKKLIDFAQAVPDISMIMDEEGRYIEIFTQNGNEKMLRPKEELIGLALQQVITELGAEEMMRQLQQTISDRTPQSHEYELNLRNEKRYFEVRMAPMSYLCDGKRTVAVVATEITEQRLTQRKLELAYDLRRKSDFLNDIIMGNTLVDEKAILTAKTLEIDFALPVVCCLIAPEQTHSVALQSLKSNMFEALSDIGCIVWDCRDGIGILSQANENCSNCMSLALLLKTKTEQHCPDLTAIIGVSEAQTGLDGIKESYRQAWSAVTAARCQEGQQGGIHRFRDLGVYQLLAGLGGKEQADKYIDATIGKLIAYDKLKNTDFLFTLAAILQNTNLKEAAEKIFLHPKTLVFRRKRIEKILGLSLDPFENRLALATAIKLHKLRAVTNG